MPEQPQHPELAQPERFFSPEAQHIVEAVLATNPGDDGAAMLAIRLGRDLTTSFEGLQRTNEPVSVTLVVASRNTDVERLLDAVADTYIGRFLEHICSWTEVNGYVFGDNPAALVTAPADQPALLHPDNLRASHSMVRNGNFVIAFQKVAAEFNTFVNANRQHINESLELQQMQQALMEEARALNQLLATRNAEEGPLRSVIGITNLEQFTPAGTAGIIKRFIRGALFPMTYPEDATPYRTAIILLAAEVPETYISGASSRERYRAVREYLATQQWFLPLQKDLGDRIIVLGDTTDTSVESRIDAMLSMVTHKLAKLDVTAVFPDDFRNFLLEKSKDPDAEGVVFPANRPRDIVRRFVLHPLSWLVRRQKLSRDMALTFHTPQNANEPDEPEISPTGTDTSPPLSREEVGKAFWLMQSDEPEEIETLRDHFETFKRKTQEPPSQKGKPDDSFGLYL